MYTIEPFRKENAETIAAWCRGKGETFLYQWGVDDYRYPLTAEQIETRLRQGAEIFQVTQNGALTATIEILFSKKTTATAGKFLVDPSRTAKGVGSTAMTAFQQYCKETLGFSALSIYAFDFNLPALKCYQKCGFSPVAKETRKNGMTAILLTAEL